MRIVPLLVLAAVLLAGCTARSGGLDPAKIALLASEVGPRTNVTNETHYEGAAGLAPHATDWSNESELRAWGFLRGFGRTMTDERGEEIDNSVYVFANASGAHSAFRSLDALFVSETPPWAKVDGSTVGAESDLFRYDTPGGAGWVLNAREGAVAMQVLAIGESIDAARMTAWAKSTAARVDAAPA
ncbi:MAG: hypothetical protein ACYDCK_14025 [Thermoplasmatota archaeon]